MFLSRPSRRLIILLSLVTLAGALACAVAWPVAQADARALAQAEQRWGRRDFAHYRLEIMDKNCTQSIEVLNERIVRVVPNRCEAVPSTISDLFALIRRDGEVANACIVFGCVCDDVIRVDAVYNQSLGYPERILVRMRAEPNWFHMDMWKHLWSKRTLPSCNFLAEGSKIIRILSITPVR